MIDFGPDWNFLTPATNTILYTFSVATGNQSTRSGQHAFTDAQQALARGAMQYLAALTGINFVETSDGDAAQVHLCDIDIAGADVAGLCSWRFTPTYVPGTDTLSDLAVSVYVYLDDVEWREDNLNLTPGGWGYETLLHELGHMLGLKHPFDDDINLPDAQDNTANTLMSYNTVDGPHSVYSQYDIAAINWIYGQDGLGGALGVGSVTGARFITGTSGADTLVGTGFDDALEGDGGNDSIDGGAGVDTAIFAGLHTAYTIRASQGKVIVTGADGSDTLSGVEQARFADGLFVLASLVDTTPPAAPSATVVSNAAGYIAGNLAQFSGNAEAGATVQLWNGSQSLGTATATAKGAWHLTSGALADGSYTLTATATDASGNVSSAGAPLPFVVDTHAPAAPSESVSANASGLVAGNQPVISGVSEAGARVQVSSADMLLGTAVANSAGAWSVTPIAMANGSYNVSARAFDGAGNVSPASAPLAFRVVSSDNLSGTEQADRLQGTSANNFIDGGAGIDSVVYGEARANFTVTKAANGFVVADHGGGAGTDVVSNVERLLFSDGAVALDVGRDSHGGDIYRLYQAAFDRAPDAGGVGFWLSMYDRGVSRTDIAGAFLSSAEFTSLYGSNLNVEAYVTRLYNNVLHRAPEQGGFEFWVHAINNGFSRVDTLVEFSKSDENVAQLVGVLQNGFDYTPLA